MINVRAIRISCRVMGFLIVFSTLALFEIPLECFGQQKYRFDHLDNESGLIFNDVHSIQQDNLGFIWLEHFSALSRFDGYEIKTYQYDPDDSLRSMLNYQMGSFLEDHQGNRYLTRGNVWLRYNPGTDGFVPLSIPSLGDVPVQSIIFEKDGLHLWLGTYLKGLFKLNIKSGQLVNYFNREAPGDVLQNDINNVEDLGNSLLLVTLKGLWLFDKASGKFSRPNCNPDDSTFLYKSPMGGAIKDSNGNFWIRSIPGIARYNKVDGYPDFVDVTEDNRGSIFILDRDLKFIHRFKLPSGHDVSFGGVDENGVLWGASRQILFRYDPSDTSFTLIESDPSDPHSLKDNSVNAVMIDKDQNVWVGTNKGVSILRKKGLQFFNISLGEATVGTSSLFQGGGKEYLVLGRKRQPGLYDKNPNDVLFARVIPGLYNLEFKPTLGPIPAYALHDFLNDGNIFWVAATGAGVFGYPIDSRTGLILNEPSTIYISDPRNKNTLGRRLVSALLKDKGGNLWVGNNVTGLDFVSGSLPYGTEGSVRNFRHDENNPNTIQAGQIHQLYRESDQAFWIITGTGVDLFHFDQELLKVGVEHVFSGREAPCNLFKSDDSTLFLGTERGLYVGRVTEGKYDFQPLWMKAAVYGIQEDKKGRLWLYSSNGPVCYRFQDKAAIEFSSIDGVENFHTVALGGLHHTRDGRMIMIDPDGISMFDPLSLQIDTSKIVPVLTHLEVNNKPVIGSVPKGAAGYSVERDITLLDELTLNYRHNHFSIRFSAMEMTGPAKNRYRHKLEGYDPDWIETDYRNRGATYTNLPAGTYTFRAKASNHHGVWSEKERILKVIILPPPWRTWWAYTGYSLLAFGLLLLARRSVVQRERLQANLKLEHLELEKAKEVDRVKTSFFTNISHEFRTPLTLIKGPVQNMIDQFMNGQSNVDKDKVVHQLKLVQRNSDLLLRLINQLLDLAKLESGTLKVEASAGDAHGFIRAIASGFESHARQKGVTLKVEVPQEPAAVMFDKDKLETILINLVNNAIKFTAAGGSVTVTGKLQTPNSKSQTPNPNGCTLALSVQDTGLGIPADQRDKIFERFHQVSESHKEVGTGIGLALVKELVTLMGGTITVESEMGKGSTFKIAVPVEAAAEIAEVPTEVTGHRLQVAGDAVQSVPPRTEHPVPSANGMEGVASTKAQILVVEDNVDVRQFIIDSLGEDYGYLEAENGREGLTKATTEIPDLIISDVMMPEMDGITMAGKIKEDRNTSHIPLILLTAKSTEESKLSGLSSGADDYLTKPFNKQELLLKVRNSINRQNKLKELLRNELLTETPKEKVLSQDEQFLQKVKETIVARMSDEQLSVESLADDMGMSRVQLYRKVSALTGLAANELIRKLRLQRAAQLLGQNWGPVSQVAYEVGITNLSYFGKVFKEEFGSLPSEYVERT